MALKNQLPSTNKQVYPKSEGKEGEEGITFDVKYTRAQVETYGTATKSWAHLGYRAVGR